MKPGWKMMILHKYILVKNVYFGDTEFVRYGIAALDITELPPIVIRTVADLTGDLATAQALAIKCNTNNTPTCELDEIIDEFLSNYKV
ncbi:MAG: hypothetical protein J6A85_05630 [Clostridia bacterium]|nr:hypothetical protein [Clostridia bacterium]